MRRKFVTPWNKAAQEVGDGGAEDRVERLAAAASSSTALSPRVTLDGSNVGGQRGKKRKSPCVPMPFFTTPLSRMLMSPVILRRSPSIQHRASPSATTAHGICQGREQRRMQIDLNLAPGDTDTQGSGEGGFDHGAATDAQYSGVVGFDEGAATYAQEDEEEGLETNHVPSDQEDEEKWVEPNPEPDVEEGGPGPNLEPNPEQNAQQSARKKFVPNDKRRAIFDDLLVKAKNGNLKGHETALVSAKFSVNIRTVQRIWKQGKACLDQGQPVDVRSRKSLCGRKKIDVDVSKLEDLPILSRTTMENVAAYFGVSKSKVQTMKKEGALKRVSSALKPDLTEQNRIDRLKWCLSMLDPRSMPHDPMFKALFDYIHIDEKWFYITKNTVRYYADPNGSRAFRTCKNKNYIPKLMILTALARPRFNSSGACVFDGKIGCFPFVEHIAAKRSSVNRPAGTIELKPIESITKDVIRNFMIEKVLPAIRAKWPREDADKTIYIQQDNARPHISPDDRQFCEAAKQDGFSIKLICQPANSPDMNVLDLGFFNAIQSIQQKTASNTIADLVAAIDQAFQNYSVNQANRIFLTLHSCMKEVITIHGGHKYDIPHLRKEMLERQGRLPLQLKCDASIVRDASIVCDASLSLSTAME